MEHIRIMSTLGSCWHSVPVSIIQMLPNMATIASACQPPCRDTLTSEPNLKTAIPNEALSSMVHIPNVQLPLPCPNEETCSARSGRASSAWGKRQPSIDQTKPIQRFLKTPQAQAPGARGQCPRRMRNCCQLPLPFQLHKPSPRTNINN